MKKVQLTYKLPPREKYTPSPETSLSCSICGSETEFNNLLCFDCICDMQDGSSERIQNSVKNHDENPRYHDIDDIIAKVSSYTGISIEDIKTKKGKPRGLVETRQIAQYFSKKNNCGSLAFIGNKIGGKDHATVLHSCKTVENLRGDKKFMEKYSWLFEYYLGEEAGF